MGGTYPYTYSWTFGDGSTGLGASTSHIYNTPGMMTVVCTVMDGQGTHANDASEMLVTSDPSIISFTASPPSPLPGEKVTFVVSTSGGYGSLSYSYANLPAGCLSTNATSLSCYPASSGNYRVTVTVTERGGEFATSTVSITVGPQKVLGLPRALGLAAIFGGILGISAIVVLSIVMVLRRRKRPQTQATT
jgi:PKD repeat protein